VLQKAKSRHRNYTAGVSPPAEFLFPHFQARMRNSRHAGTGENKSPYPGINIGSATELLDFRFEETEIL
jgi:hypothetical protein